MTGVLRFLSSKLEIRFVDLIRMPSRPKSRLPTGLFVKKPVTPLDKRSNVPAKSVMAGG